MSDEGLDGTKRITPNPRKDEDEAKLESLAKRLLSTPPVPRDELSGKGKPKRQPQQSRPRHPRGMSRASVGSRKPKTVSQRQGAAGE